MSIDKLPKRYILDLIAQIVKSANTTISENYDITGDDLNKSELDKLYQELTKTETHIVDIIRKSSGKNDTEIDLYISKLVDISDRISKFKIDSLTSLNKKYKDNLDLYRKQSLNKLFIEYGCLSELLEDLLLSVKDNIKNASEPLSLGIYEIRKSINDFVNKVKSWEDELINENSDTNFDRILDDFKRQQLIFDNLAGVVNVTATNLDSNLDDMSNMVKRIENNSDLIRDIASRTQLLSFNASIEAAHAGIHGKGFKIIANETKKLSDQTQSLLKSIVEEINITKLTLVKIIEEQKSSREEINIKLNDQKEGLSGYSNILGIYKSNFNKIFATVSNVSSQIYGQLNTISPTFQLHDLITQEIDNIEVLLREFIREHNDDFGNLKELFSYVSEDEILDNFMKKVEEHITTDNEVEIVAKHIKKYGLVREHEVKKGDMEIEFF